MALYNSIIFYILISFDFLSLFSFIDPQSYIHFTRNFSDVNGMGNRQWEIGIEISFFTKTILHYKHYLLDRNEGS